MELISLLNNYRKFIRNTAIIDYYCISVPPCGTFFAMSIQPRSASLATLGTEEAINRLFSGENVSGAGLGLETAPPLPTLATTTTACRRFLPARSLFWSRQNPRAESWARVAMATVRTTPEGWASAPAYNLGSAGSALSILQFERAHLDELIPSRLW